MDWQVEHQCPQCSGPVLLTEVQRVYSCAYCKVKLLLSSEGPFRYVLLPKEPNVRDFILVPYWRIKGFLFSLHSKGFNHRVVDTSRAAARGEGFPFSLGLRPQAMKLHFLRPEQEGLIEVDQDFSLVLNSVERSLSDVDITSGDSAWHGFLGDPESLVYQPFYVENDRLFDGITRKGLGKVRGDYRVERSIRSKWYIKSLPCQCPYCGWDLKAGPDSCVGICENCNTGYDFYEGHDYKVELNMVDLCKDADIYLPFWRMKCSVSGIRLESYADFVTFFNLPKAITPSLRNKEMLFWSPAFRINPDIFMRLCRQITIAAPEKRVEVDISKINHFPITFRGNELSLVVRLLIASLGTNRKDIVELLSEIKIDVVERSIDFIPFMITRGEYIQEEMNFSILRGPVEQGRKL